ncbi:hypothetical protein P0F65_20995 [Sphingomonas sp. I4]
MHTANPLGNGYDVQGDVLLRANYREAGWRTASAAASMPRP